MSKLYLSNRVPPQYDSGMFSKLFRDVELQVNGLTEGSVTPVHSATTAAPTTGTYAVGDVIRNSTPAEAGAGGSKYVIIGWICTVSGTPGTWLQMRVLTGN